MVYLKVSFNIEVRVLPRRYCSTVLPWFWYHVQGHTVRVCYKHTVCAESNIKIYFNCLVEQFLQRDSGIRYLISLEPEDQSEAFIINYAQKPHIFSVGILEGLHLPLAWKTPSTLSLATSWILWLLLWWTEYPWSSKQWRWRLSSIHIRWSKG